MTTAIDTNVLLALWDIEPTLNEVAKAALDAALGAGPLVICGAVYAELLAFPGRSESMLNSFFSSTGIRVDWETQAVMWKRAGMAFQGYIARRKASKGDTPRRILADFLIGAHAEINRCRLLTLDQRLYHAAFPKLRILTF